MVERIRDLTLGKQNDNHILNPTYNMMAVTPKSIIYLHLPLVLGVMLWPVAQVRYVTFDRDQGPNGQG